MKQLIKRLMTSIMISGGTIFCIGCYYTIIKAGIPYQDPPLEIQIKYAISMGIGNELIKVGFAMILIGLVIYLIIKKVK